jgi:hypothetical protein
MKNVSLIVTSKSIPPQRSASSTGNARHIMGAASKLAPRFGAYGWYASTAWCATTSSVMKARRWSTSKPRPSAGLAPDACMKLMVLS